MREATLIRIAAEVVADEEVLVAALFEPAGAIEGEEAAFTAGSESNLLGPEGGAGAAGGLGRLLAPRVAAATEQVPRWCLVAVTERHVHLLEVTTLVPYTKVTHPRPFAVLERPTTSAATSEHGDIVRLVLTDTATDRHYRLEFSRSRGHGAEVIAALDTV